MRRAKRWRWLTPALVALLAVGVVGFSQADTDSPSEVDADVDQLAQAEPQAPDPDGQDTPVPQATYVGGPATLVFHLPGCAECTDCSEEFHSPSSALRDGYLPDEVCHPLLEPLPTSPSEETSCDLDEDCVAHANDGCGCGPCGWDWPQVMNRESDEWLRGQYAIEACQPMDCVECPAQQSGYLPVTLSCVDGTCQMSYW